MKASLQNLPKNTVKLTITVSAEEVKKSQEKIWGEVTKNAELDGFRKGNAPAELVKQKVDPRKVESEIINDLIKTYYPQAVEEQKLLPVIAPKIEVEDFDAEKDFTFSALTATRPIVTVGDYKKAIKDLYDKRSRSVEGSRAPRGAGGEIRDPRREGAGTSVHDDHVHLSPNEVIEAITSVSTAEISDLLVEDEVNKMLSRLINQLQALKLDTEAYLKSQNKTAESLKAEYTQIAQKNITGELAMMDVVKKEGVEATDTEVEQTLNAMGDAKLKEQYSKDEYQKAYIKAIIAKNKAVWKLSSPEEDRKIETDDAKKEENDVKN